MTTTCELVRERLLEARGGPPLGDPASTGHLESCAACAAYAGQVARIASAVSALPRLHTPRELEGLAVATFHEGFLQDRAVMAMRALGRLPTPRELSGRTLSEEGSEVGRGERRSRRPEKPWMLRAPAVLDRLVDEDLRDASAGVHRRITSRLERRRAPRALRDRLERSSRLLLGPRPMRRLRAAAAALLLLAGGGLWLRLRAPGEAASGADFEVVHEARLDAMDPMARSMLAGISGGIVDLGGRAR